VDPIDDAVLAICTSRQSESFLRDACGLHNVRRLEVGESPSRADIAAFVERVESWLEQHPDGTVISTSDIPSVIHALATRSRPNRGACLAPILATLDKVWARANVLDGISDLAWSAISAGSRRIPDIDSDEVIVKPVDGCASAGVYKTAPGRAFRSTHAPNPWLRALRRRELGDAPIVDDAVAIAEAYVPPYVARVSVDGWIDADGTPRGIAISDNRYVDGDPERFDYQLYPSRLSDEARAVCWDLWNDIAMRLADEYGMRAQCFDIEMFAWEPDDGHPARADVMEINARLHPNITPVLRRVLRGGDPLGLQVGRPWRAPERVGAGAMFYVWTRGEEPRFDRVDSTDDVVACPFSTGSEIAVRDHICWGWLYVFGDEPEAVVARGKRLRKRIVGS
jgi:hypothetical protein